MAGYKERMKSAEYHLRGHRQDSLEFALRPLIEKIGSVVPDIYGTGEVIESFQNQISEETGLESSIFFPSGTMAQQIALRLWCEEKKCFKVAYHPLSHLEIHENDAIRAVHHIEPVLLGEKGRLFTLKDLEEVTNVACVLFELPQRDLGGQLPEWDELVDMVNHCRLNGIKTHLDGARVFETLPYYGKSIQDVCTLFDSVYISFYKTFGAITGVSMFGPLMVAESGTVIADMWIGDAYLQTPHARIEQALNLLKEQMQ